MKFATLALFLGAISAQEYDEELINEIKIEVSKAGQAAIEKEARDVGQTMKKIEHSRPVRNLGASAKRFLKTKEVHEYEMLDKKFWASKAGQNLKREWMDVGHVLKEHLHQDKKTGALHMDNSAVDDLSDELDDVEGQYKHLEGSKWDKAYEAAVKKAFATKQFAALKRRAHSFKGSNEGKMLHKEMRELKMAIQKNLKVTDLESDSSDEEDIESAEDMLKITTTQAGRNQIKKEMKDVEKTWHSIEKSRPVRNLGASLNRWGHSQEMKDLEALDKKFMSTPRGKRMAREIGDVFKHLDDSVYHNKAGLQIDNKALETLDDEVNDVEDEFKSFKKSKWNKIYETAMQKVFSNKQAHSVERRAKAFKASPQGKALHKEMKELGETLKKNVKISDIKRFDEEKKEEEKKEKKDDGLYLF